MPRFEGAAAIEASAAAIAVFCNDSDLLVFIVSSMSLHWQGEGGQPVEGATPHGSFSWPAPRQSARAMNWYTGGEPAEGASPHGVVIGPAP